METKNGVDLANKYREKLLKAKIGVGYHNCAGFVKYLLNLSPTETYVRLGDPGETGLIKYLSQESMLPLKDFSEESYLENVNGNDVVGILQNNNSRWTYLHFFVPSPDPSTPFEVFQRNGFEKEVAEAADVRDLVKDEEYKGDTRMIFFKRK